MSDLKLSFAMTEYDYVMPLITGEVKPDGITLEYQGMPGLVPGVFYDQLRFSRYDVSEMSFSSFLRARPQGWGYRILPVFHNRQFSYTRIVIRLGSGIRQDHPEDLRGKRIGTGDYQQTAALWTRGVLQHEFNLKPEDMIWYQERPEKHSHGGATGFVPPAGLEFHYATKDFGTMYRDGEIDATIGYGAGGAVDRERTFDITNNPEYPLLFTDPKAEAIRYYRKTGIYSPHHTTAVRDSILQEHPWVAISLLNAFEKAKRLAQARLNERQPRLLVFSSTELAEQREIFGADTHPYGVKANAAGIDFVQQISVEQGLTDRKQRYDEIFPEEILITEELA
ncbi:MAG: hypothetical protein ACKVVP_15575 [Chloroflexota bacterium]